MINPIMILLFLALAGPVASWGLTSLNAKWEREAAVATERSHAQAAVDKERNVCNASKAEFQTKLNNQTAELQRLAEIAERSMAPTPVEAAELQDLCNRSASCVDRKELKK